MDLTTDGVARLLDEVGARPPTKTTPRIDGMTPALVLEPEDADGCARALALCHEEEMALIPVGGATRLGIGNLPARLDAYLDLRLLSGVEDHIPGDLTAALGAGTTLDAVQEALGREGQFLPLDAPDPSRATIGGILASGEPGMRRRPGGRPRDVLVGFEAVLADGTPVKAGGRVVKNVAGYELMKLVVGSLGTLAVLTRVFVRLRALPEKVLTLCCSARSARDASESWRRLRDLPLAPEATALLNPKASAALGTNEWSLLLRYEGLSEEIEGAATDVSERVKVEPASDSIWHDVRDFPTHGESDLCLRGQVAPARAFDLAHAWQDGGALMGLPDAGLVYSHTESLDALADRRDQAGRLSGTVVLEKVPSTMKRELDVFGDPPRGFSLMKRIKEKLDPRGVLSPGRFVGRI